MQDSLNTLPEPASNISLREYGEVLRRRRAIILQTFVIVLVAGVLVTLFTPPTYQSSARLLLEPQAFTINQVTSSDPLGDLMRVGSQYSLGTQVELLQTSKILGEVRKQLGDRVDLPRMNISVLEGTTIIEIDSEGDNPQIVADAPNQLMQIFVDESSGLGKETLDNALKFAQEQEDLAQNKLTLAENNLTKFQKLHHLQDFEANLAAQTKVVSDLSANYETEKEEMSVLQERNRATLDQMKVAGKTKNPVLSPLADPDMKAIDNQLFALDAQINSVYKQVGGFSPTGDVMAHLWKQQHYIEDRKALLRREFKDRNSQLNPVYSSFQDSLLQNAIQERELALRAQLTEQHLAAASALLGQFPNWQSQFEQLQRAEADAKRSLDLFTNSAFNLLLRQKTQRQNASIMELAVPPGSPVKPKKPQNILFSGLAGLFLGLCLALLQELFDDRINNPEEAERVLRLPTLGHVPMIEEEGLRLIRDISTFSPLMEAYRSLRTNINFAAVGSPLHSLVVTSSVPAEGKSTTVANLAMAMALDNKRVIVVDADLRRPSLHKLFKKESSPGLTDILVGTHTMEDVIRDTNVPGVRVIPAGSPPPNPAELLGSAAMGHLLSLLEENCDIVIFDTPPTLAVADSVVLASRADGVILVVGYGETKKASSRKAIEVLGRANANVLGTVMNRIEGPSSGYYYGKYYVPTADRPGGTALRDQKRTAGAQQPSPRNLDQTEAESLPMIPAPNETPSTPPTSDGKRTDDGFFAPPSTSNDKETDDQ